MTNPSTSTKLSGSRRVRLEVSDDTLMPDFVRGDIAMVDPDAPVEAGDWIVSRIGADPNHLTLHRCRDYRSAKTVGRVVERQRRTPRNLGAVWSVR